MKTALHHVASVVLFVLVLPFGFLYTWLEWLMMRGRRKACAHCGQVDEVLDGVRYIHQCFPRGAHVRTCEGCGGKMVITETMTPPWRCEACYRVARVAR